MAPYQLKPFYEAVNVDGYQIPAIGFKNMWVVAGRRKWLDGTIPKANDKECKF